MAVQNRKRNKKILQLVVAVLLLIGLVYLIAPRDKSGNQVSAPTNDFPEPTTSRPVASFDKTRYSLTDPASLWMIVNKQRALPANYTPVGLTNSDGSLLRPEAATAIKQMIEEARKNGLNLRIISGYRSYQSQQSVYSNYVIEDGQTAADTYSARPGHSEHQTGLAADIGGLNRSCDLEICFGDTAEGKWLAAHANDYGFIIRYTQTKTEVTGYQYEPWHVRFVGLELAKELKGSNQTLEEFFGLGAAPNY